MNQVPDLKLWDLGRKLGLWNHRLPCFMSTRLLKISLSWAYWEMMRKVLATKISYIINWHQLCHKKKEVHCESSKTHMPTQFNKMLSRSTITSIFVWCTANISTVLNTVFSQWILKQIQGVLCLRCFMRLWKNNRVSRKLCKRRSDLVLNGQMRVPK